MKRYISILLCLCMAVSFAVPAFADGPAMIDAGGVIAAATEVVAETPVEADVSAKTEAPEATDAPEETVETEDAAEQLDAPTGTRYPIAGYIEGTDITWVITSDLTLTITGTEPLPDFTVTAEGVTSAPWGDRALNVVIDEDITYVGDYSFYGCRMRSVSLPSTLESIGDYAFSFCGSLTAIRLPEGLEAIGEGAFHNTGLMAVSLPGTLKSIGAGAFYNNTALTMVTVEEGITVLPEDCFRQCGKLDSVKLPSTLKAIGKCAFAWCPLMAVTLPDGLEIIGEQAFQDTRITKLTLPGGLLSIGACAFYGCMDLTDVTVGEGITELPEGCFSQCEALKTLGLPSTIETLEANCFESCILQTVTVAGSEEYVFVCWYDEQSDRYYYEEDMVSGFVNGHRKLTALWLNRWVGFEDVSQGDWYYDYVKYCYEYGLMAGMGDGTFAPQGSATRGQVATVLYRLAGEPAVSGSAPFTDVYEGDWYHDAVAWAASAGVAVGYEDGSFHPQDNVTREQFIVFLYRLTDTADIILNDWAGRYDLTTSDAEDVSDWAESGEIWSLHMGLQVGYANGAGTKALNPQGHITRAELATFLSRYAADMYWYGTWELAESMRGETAENVRAVFGEPDRTEIVNDSICCWYYYDYEMRLEMHWHEDLAVWYLYLWYN